MNEMTRDTFARTINRRRGTLVFGAGVEALRCEIIEIWGDYIMARDDSHGVTSGPLVAVPISAIVYFRFDVADDA